ncbi:zinc finger and BTB domain-containing protein 49-like [Trichogramma pretiosum]|uniref:zinc finger and BTB domain-containing protein 49-like n=1 Tax=Trichogramma pretiosum TaxID=7493 RepID=UPI000C719684|nr:zinc finger and BTB domain-containing protein 49-like [Trichogramma pretiosum]
MESSDTLDCAVRVKEEPSDMSFTENYWDTVDEKPDLKNFQLLPLLEDNSIIRKCDENHESKLNNEVKIVFECEDVKPNIDLSIVKQIDDYSQNHLQYMNYSDNDKTQDTIKIEPAVEVERDTFGNDAEKLNLNYNCERSEKNNMKRIAKKVKNNHNLKIHINSVNNGIDHVCGICGKKFTQKGNLKIHIDAIHNGMAPTCEICGKKFQTKNKLKIHIDSRLIQRSILNET